MRKVQFLGLATGTLFALMTMLLMWLFRAEIVAVYTSDLQVTQVAMYLILFAIAYQLMDAWQVMPQVVYGVCKTHKVQCGSPCFPIG